jgi:hypothetical protein
MGPPLGPGRNSRDGIVTDYFCGTARRRAEPGIYADVRAILEAARPDPAELRWID